MTNAFGRTLRPEWIAFGEALEKFRHTPAEEQDPRELVKAAGLVARTGLQLPEVGPVFGALSACMEEFEYNWCLRLLIRLTIWTMRQTSFRNRPLWNDFEMTRWLVTKDPRYVKRIAQQMRSKNPMVQATCEWMVASMCQQEPEFKAQWEQVTA